MGHLLGDARVSTTHQQPHLQVDALTAAGCSRVFTETASGARADALSSSSCWTSSAPATPWWSGNWTGWAARCATWARGRRGGRPSALTGHKLQIAREMHASGQYTVAALAQALGVSRASIYRHLTRSTAD